MTVSSVGAALAGGHRQHPGIRRCRAARGAARWSGQMASPAAAHRGIGHRGGDLPRDDQVDISRRAA